MKDKLETVYQRLDLVGNIGEDNEDADTHDQQASTFPLLVQQGLVQPWPGSELQW